MPEHASIDPMKGFLIGFVNGEITRKDAFWKIVE